MNDDHSTHPPRPAATGADVLWWRPIHRQNLIGYARVRFPSGVVVSEIAILRGRHEPWAAPPTRPMIKNGAVVREANGKTRYITLIEFPSQKFRNAWSRSIIKALREAYPNFDSETTKEFEE